MKASRKVTFWGERNHNIIQRYEIVKSNIFRKGKSLKEEERKKEVKTLDGFRMIRAFVLLNYPQNISSLKPCKIDFLLRTIKHTHTHTHTRKHTQNNQRNFFSSSQRILFE